ncbi:carbonic anhydrase [Dendrothele bispora CBS 962.96]|uniref:Carbonic anhydrase n=1 Tax=Dendrothele bispora (strain CBS 962.96) TaxID=1314807 RepID=A0A4S8MQD4_DENBC|nr:carbonic anhydrase [Dendrothele bispora CBS 962.96]
MSEAADYSVLSAEFTSSYEPPDIESNYKGTMVVICIDPRVNSFVSSVLPYAVIARNAGGRAKAALRDIVVSQEIAVRDVAVVHHTDCGMCHFSSDSLRQKIKQDNPGDEVVAKSVEEIDFDHIEDLEGSVRSDVEYLKAHPLVKKDTKVTGWVYDIKAGKITRVD